MRDLEPNNGLEYSEELLIPRINTIAYRQIYILETWLRRICLSAWMSSRGENWQDGLDSRLASTLRTRVHHNRQRIYLGAENDGELIWQATHGELIRLLAAEQIADQIEKLTGVKSDFLVRKIDEVREIRNLLAHNRALAQRTYVILSGLLASLEEAVDHFRRSVLYGPSSILMENDGDELGIYLDEKLHGNDWKKFQAFVSRKGDFVELTCLPVAPFDRVVDVKQLLRAFSEHISIIIAFCLNKLGDEYIILTSRNLPRERHFALCDTFVKNPNVWTKIEYVDQEPRDVCSPKVWFYENNSPFD